MAKKKRATKEGQIIPIYQKCHDSILAHRNAIEFLFPTLLLPSLFLFFFFLFLPFLSVYQPCPIFRHNIFPFYPNSFCLLFVYCAQLAAPNSHLFLFYFIFFFCHFRFCVNSGFFVSAWAESDDAQQTKQQQGSVSFVKFLFLLIFFINFVSPKDILLI